MRAVKELQGREPEAREQWHNFTDAYDPAGRSTRNPERHTLEFLQSFLDQYNKGMRFQASDSALGYTQLIKAGTNKSATFKAQWEEYCHKWGDSKLDPSKQPPEFHVNFLDYISQRSAMLSEMERESFKAMMQGMHANNNDDEEDDGTGEPSAKRMKAALTLPIGMMGLDLSARARLAADMALLSQADPEKDSLVRRVKNYQRKGKSEVELWYAWCGSKRDPSRHTTDRLREFVAKNCIPDED